MSSTGARLQVLREKMDVLRLTFYTAPVSVGILLPFFLMTEFRHLVKYGYATDFHPQFLRVTCVRLVQLASTAQPCRDKLC